MSDHSHAENTPHKSHKKEYMMIFVMLGVLTVLEIWAAEIDALSKFSKGVILTVLAIAKAFLVAFYYMHLKEETKWTRFIAAIPILAAVFATVLCLEAIYKPF